MRILRVASYFLIFALMVAVAGCATKPATGGKDAAPSSVQASATGLAPAGDAQFRTISFAISVGNPEAVKAWTLKIGTEKSVVKTVSGNASNLPANLSWDGKADSGAMAPEGSYTAMLAVDYGEAFNAGQAASKSFILDITPPSGTFSPNPALFPYSAEGVKGPIAVNVAVKPALAKVASWSIGIFDPAGKQVKTLSAAWPTSQAGWDGKTDSGAAIEMNVSYPATLTVKDEFGNAGTFQGSFAISNMPAAGNSTIAARRRGFSPTSVIVKNTLDILTSVGSRDSVSAWKIEIAGAAGGAVKTFSGGAGDVPSSVTWDGKSDAGSQAPDGSYTATLSVNYGKAFMPSVVRSEPFSVVTAPPEGSVTVDPQSVNLTELGPKNPIKFTVQAVSSHAEILRWTLSVLDPKGVSVAIFQANWPNNTASWDGKTVEGSSLIPGATYNASAKVQDEYGNVGTFSGALVAGGLPAAPEPTSLTASAPGFSPTDTSAQPTIDFALAVGNKAQVTGWKLDIVNPNSIVAKNYSGTAAKLPAAIAWNGKGDDGKLAAQGTYVAVLTVSYGLTYAQAKVESKSFVLDLTPPTGSVALSTKLFSPDGDGENDTETISLNASSSFAPIAGWTISILDPDMLPFASFTGSWPAQPVVWDGKGANGDLVESAADYTVVAKFRDQYGCVGEAKSVIPTDILVIKEGNGYRIRVSSIVFKPYSADFEEIPKERAERNILTLNLLAAKLAHFPDYKVRLVGHAVMINWNDKAKGAAEQAAILIPLSQSRAEAIKAALVKRDVAAERLVTEGVGAKDPIVPDSDYANRWKNRRVDFFLVK